MAQRITDDPERDRLFTEEEGRELFEREVQRLLGISCAEFLRRWDAGEYRDTPDTPENWHIYHIMMMMPLARAVPA